MQRFLLNSRIFTTMIVVGMFVVMLSGYQNCGKATFKRGGNLDSSGSPNLVAGSTAEIIPVVQNGGNFSIGTTDLNTCKGLSDIQISNGAHRDITINLMSLHFIPTYYRCLRVQPITDVQYYKCNLPDYPEQTYRPDGGEPQSLGVYSVSSVDNTSAQLHFTNVADGHYEMEFVGQSGDATSEWHTNPARVNFTVAPCSSVPNPSPSPTGSVPPTPSPSPSNNFWIVGVMSSSGDGNPDEWMTNPDRMSPMFVISNGAAFTSYKVTISTGIAVTSPSSAPSSIQDPWQNCINQIVTPTLLPSGNATLLLDSCVFQPNIDHYNVSIWGLTQPTQDGTPSMNQQWNFGLMTTPVPSPSPTSCSDNSGEHPGWGACSSNPPPPTKPVSLFQCEPDIESCCAMPGYAGSRFFDGVDILNQCGIPPATPAPSSFKVLGVFKPSVDPDIDNALSNSNDDPIFRVTTPTSGVPALSPIATTFDVTILNPRGDSRMGIKDIILCEKTITGQETLGVGYDLQVLGCHLDTMAGYRAVISTTQGGSISYGDPNPFAFDVKGITSGSHSCEICPNCSTKPDVLCTDVIRPCVEYSVDSEKVCCDKAAETTPVYQSTATYDGAPLSCGGGSCAPNTYSNITDCTNAGHPAKSCVLSNMACMVAPCCNVIYTP